MSQMTPSHAEDVKTVSLGFWLYLMTDCLLFASLFATFAVLRHNTAGGPSGAELFDMNYVLLQTMALLASSATSGVALLAVRYRRYSAALLWTLITIALGASFFALELHEFNSLIEDGAGWQVSAFLSAFFTLVATHGIHIAIGLVWATVLIVVMLRHGLSPRLHKQFALFTLFWHFLDIIWIFIFTFVYALGVVA